MINVLHTVNAFTALSGGTATCTYDLLRALNSRPDLRAQILVTQPVQPLMGNGEAWIMAVANDEKTAFGISANLRQALLQSEADIYHTNGLWRYCNHVTAAVARRKNKPYVITPHGMLYPQALAHSRWQKQLLCWSMFDTDLREAACIHVTCEEEMRHVRALGYKTPVAVIGNPVPEFAVAHANRTGKVRFGFLGRLDPIKQVERIIDALALLSAGERQRCELLVMGAGLPEYEAALRSRVQRLELENVRFVGFVEGGEKQQLLASLSALFVASKSENFGMMVAEALSCGVPVFANTTTPWEMLDKRHCGWWKEATVENMAQAMRRILAMSPREIDEMGANGKQLVRECFSAPAVAQQMSELYQWILTQQAKPSFVYE